MTTQQPSFGARWIVACIERLYACAYDIAARSTRRQWHPATGVVLWLLASVAALCGTLTRVPAVLLDVKRLEYHRKRLWLLPILVATPEEVRTSAAGGAR